MAHFSWSHKYLTTLSNEQIVAEIMWTAKLIKEITGVTPNIVRPPCKFSSDDSVSEA